MAQIREYNAPTGEEVRPSDLGETSLVRAARTIGAEGNQSAAVIRTSAAKLGSAVAQWGEIADKHASFQEISQGASSFAALRNAGDAIANDAFKDPSQNTDPALGERINAQVQPLVDKWADSFHTDAGRRWALEQSAHYKESFQTRLSADKSTMAGIAATGHLNEWLKNSSNIVERDPTALAQERAQIMPTIDAMIQSLPGMSAADAAKFRDEHSLKMFQQLDMTALNKMALSNPGAARSQFQAGAFPNVDPIHAEQVLKMGDSVARQNAASDRANARLAQEQRNDAGLSQTVTKIGELTKAAQAGDTSALQKLKDMGTQILIDGPKMGMKGTSTWQAHQMIHADLENLSQRTDVVTDKAVLGDLTKAMLNPEGPQITAADIAKANLEGNISRADRDSLTQNLNLMKSDPATTTYMKQFTDNIKNFEPLIAKGMNTTQSDIPGLGDYRYKEFLTDHLKTFQQGIQSGLSAKDMLDPTKGTYIFKDLADYMTTPAQEATVFGKQFTLTSPLAPAVPTSVRIMEAYREQTRAADERKKKMDALTGITVAPRAPDPLAGLPMSVP